MCMVQPSILNNGIREWPKDTSPLFPGNLDMLWYDSEMLPVNREAYATVEQDGMILALTFPTLKSTMRLYRVPMDK